MVACGRKRFLLVSAALCASLVAAAPVPGALSPTFTANSTADEPDLLPGDRFCRTATGDCTLRAAVQEANAIGGATIDLLPGATYTLTRFGPNEDQSVTGDLDVLSNITIAVPGGRAIVQAQQGLVDRIFDVRDTNVNLDVNALDIRGGHVSVSQELGGGALGGGGVANIGTVTLTNCTVTGSSSTGDSQLSGGGGIFNVGKLTLTNSAVNGNSSTTGSQISGGGGGIVNFRSLTLTNSTVSDNRATGASGGGISNVNSEGLMLTNSTVSGNTATYDGGGISDVYNSIALSHAATTLTNSTVTGNNAMGAGGGIYEVTHSGGLPKQLILTNSTVSSNGSGQDGGGISLSGASSLTATNSTISTNSAAHNGGGLANLGTASLNNVTIADNVADSDGDGSGDGGGIFNVSGDPLSVANTILGDNVDSSTTSKVPDCVGSLTSGGFNLVENVTGCAIGGLTTGNITGQDPRLGPLQANGGATFTHALLFGVRTSPSPAIDSGNPGLTGTPCSKGSQNGVTRPVDGNADGVARCDIGAYEVPAQQFLLGTWALTPAEATAHVGERISYSLTWTVPAPRGWRSLDTLQLRFLDDQQTALWIRFQEVPGSPGTFSVVDPESGRTGPSFAPGRPNRLESNAATVYLSDTSVAGPPGTRVTLTLTLGFKPKAAGHSYDVQVLATDDTGGTQGFHRAGTITVAR